MDEQKLEDLIIKFQKSENVKALDRYFSEKSMMEILGVDRDENTHSNFLAWLFENEVIGKEACQSLIELLNKKYVDMTDEAKKGFKAIECLNNMNINKINVVREEFVSDRYQNNEDKIRLSGDDDGEIIKGRSDILIVINEGEESEAYIMIENKIDSEEICEWDSNKDTPKEKTKKEDEIDEEKKDDSKKKKKYIPRDGSLWQTQFYYNYYYNQNALTDKIVFAFLTRPDREGPKCKEHFFHINYQDIMDILCSILEQLSNKSECPQQCNQCRNAIIKIKDYMKALSKSYTQENMMAVEPRMQDLVTALNDENEKLFDFLLKCNNKERENLIAFWNSNVLNTPVRDILRPAIEMRSSQAFRAKNGKDDTRYKIGNKEFKKNPLFKQLVISYIKAYKKEHSKEPSIENLQRTFPPSLHTKKASSRSNNVTNNHIIRNDFENENNHWKKVDGFYVCQTGWDGPVMMSRLIKYIRDNQLIDDADKIQEIPLFLQEKKTDTRKKNGQTS